MADAVIRKTPAVSPTDAKALERYKQRHDAGDRLAAGQCAVFCDDNGIDPPPWVQVAACSPKAVAARWRRYLAGETAARAFVDQGPGRHGDPRTEYREQERCEESVACVRAAVCAGLTGREWLVFVGQLYDWRRPDDPIETTTVFDHYWDWQNGRIQKAPINDPHDLLLVCSGTLHALRKRR